MPAFSLFVVLAVVGTLTTAATAVRAVSRLWLRHWIEHRQPATPTMRHYLERPARLAHAAGTGITLAVFIWGAILVGNEGTRPWALARDAVIGLLLLLVLGQLLPRAIGRRWAPQLVPVLVPLLRLVDLFVTPFLRVADATTTRIVRQRPRPDQEMRDGLEDLLRDGAFEGMAASEEMAIISGVMQFGEKIVSDVMTARGDIFALDASLPAREVAERMAQSGYSRVPLFRERLDDIVGMIHVFDVFKLAGESMPALRPITRATPSKPANELLFELLRSRRQLAIVYDEQSRVVGLVTLEDLLEELVGEIRDEHDEPTADGASATAS
ncbi:MAG: CBS domain-containing protein [Gemmatimonas sp.]